MYIVRILEFEVFYTKNDIQIKNEEKARAELIGQKLIILKHISK